MLETLTKLRLAAALGHALPGGTLAMTLADGGVVQAGPEAAGVPLTTCQLRTLVLTHTCPALAVLTTQLVALEIGGDRIVDLGGGLYRRDCMHGPSVWFATLLAPATVTRLLAERSAPDAADTLTASVRPDVDLGVVVVAMTGPREREQVLERAARDASAACFTQELLLSVLSA